MLQKAQEAITEPLAIESPKIEARCVMGLCGRTLELTDIENRLKALEHKLAEV